ncbi:MAG: inorganic phosphate transporter [Bacteroidales bacterium]|nr:inorganic phosphate transporter [Bacteroidales bacterium]
MENVYLIIVGFVLLLAVFDLFVGVSNDAVNFLSSAVGCKVARFRTIIFVASFGVLIGALLSSGMMDVARHGILRPSHYSFEEVMVIFLAVMVTDVVILDIFNSFGMPTSTTVSLVFELLGATFTSACIKIANSTHSIAENSLSFADLINTDKALSVIFAIFISVIIAFTLGVVVQWLLRLVFTFKYKEKLKYLIGIFGSIAFTTLAYFILIKGIGSSSILSQDIRDYIKENTTLLLGISFVFFAILSQILHICGVNVLKTIILSGTFALAMAFASNDLVNFVGVPLTALDAFLEYISLGANPQIKMTILEQSAKSPFIYLLISGIIMCVAMITSKKAKKVIKTSVDLSKQDEGEEMFGSSKIAKGIVRTSFQVKDIIKQILPSGTIRFINKRFDNVNDYDMIRGAVNTVLSALLIIMGTTLALPLSTTYVTFMVAMGSALADRAWKRDSAVFRVTGMLSVIGGWFLTAGVAFVACALVALILHFSGFVGMFAFIALTITILVRSNRRHKDDNNATLSEKDILYLDEHFANLSNAEPNKATKLLENHFATTQLEKLTQVHQFYTTALDSINTNDYKKLHKLKKTLRKAREDNEKLRDNELKALRRLPQEQVVEKNTWFHLSHNALSQYHYCLSRMITPFVEHFSNSFSPLPQYLISEYQIVRHDAEDIFLDARNMLSSLCSNPQDASKDECKAILDRADVLKNSLSSLRKLHSARIHSDKSQNLATNLLYLALIQETQELLSILRHQVRANHKFLTQENETIPDKTQR